MLTQTRTITLGTLTAAVFALTGTSQAEAFSPNGGFHPMAAGTTHGNPSILPVNPTNGGIGLPSPYPYHPHPWPPRPFPPHYPWWWSYWNWNPYYPIGPVWNVTQNLTDPAPARPDPAQPMSVTASATDEMAPLPVGVENRGTIRVRLPDGSAAVRLNGKLVEGKGKERLVLTPELPMGQSVRYTVRANWPGWGKVVIEKRTVEVARGDMAVADFTQPASP
jgi:uncharacterized protein (TIGR03000 family)